MRICCYYGLVSGPLLSSRNFHRFCRVAVLNFGCPIIHGKYRLLLTHPKLEHWSWVRLDCKLYAFNCMIITNLSPFRVSISNRSPLEQTRDRIYAWSEYQIRRRFVATSSQRSTERMPFSNYQLRWYEHRAISRVSSIQSNFVRIFRYIDDLVLYQSISNPCEFIFISRQFYRFSCSC